MSNPVVFFDALAVDQTVLDELARLPFSNTGTRRVCLHKDETSPLHVMVVESQAGLDFPAHAHTDGDEFSTVVQGVLELTIWGEGETACPRVVRIGAQAGLAKATFVPKGVVHITRAVGGNCIYIEVKLGPFDKSAMVLKENAKLRMPK